jgi:hypothetical protein
MALLMHLDDPEHFRIWSCRFPVRTACTRWISNENGVTTTDALVTCPACLAIIDNRGQTELFAAAAEKVKREETAKRVAEARRVAMAKKRAKILAVQEARERIGTEPTEKT